MVNKDTIFNGIKWSLMVLLQELKSWGNLIKSNWLEYLTLSQGVQKKLSIKKPRLKTWVFVFNLFVPYLCHTTKTDLNLTCLKSHDTVINGSTAYLLASSTATATETVAPTIGLLPIPIRPIISTWAGTEDEPANWASECIRPMVSVIP